jgi:Replication initiator protein A
LEIELEKSPSLEELFQNLEKSKARSISGVEGRDELNLAEFPLAALSNRVNDGQKTLEFKDTIFDRQAGKLVERKLTVTAADKFGLPSAMDDEIILGLIQLSKRQGFSNRTVPFSRYEIIKILGWKDESWNYHRIIKALDRWTGVTLKYENAWWDSERKAWANETFHIIERLTEIKGDDGRERAAFVWSEVIFNNLQKGHLKTLDLDIYRSLSNPVAKRLYRLLDKRFYHRKRAQFDLVELAFHKLGIARSYMIGNIKQRLQPAIAELEAVGFIKTAGKDQRYEKHGVGQWNVIFAKAENSKGAQPQETSLPLLIEPQSEIEAELIQFGISPKKACRLATTLPEDYLRHKIDELHYLLTQNNGKISNPAGYLVKSLEENYAPPKAYKTPAQRRAETEILKQRNDASKKANAAFEEDRRRKQEIFARTENEKRDKVRDYLNSLPEDERAIIVAEAILREKSRGHGFLDRSDGPLLEKLKEQIIVEYVLQLISNV